MINVWLSSSRHLDIIFAKIRLIPILPPSLYGMMIRCQYFRKNNFLITNRPFHNFRASKSGNQRMYIAQDQERCTTDFKASDFFYHFKERAAIQRKCMDVTFTRNQEPPIETQQLGTVIISRKDKKGETIMYKYVSITYLSPDRF